MSNDERKKNESSSDSKQENNERNEDPANQSMIGIDSDNQQRTLSPKAKTSDASGDAMPDAAKSMDSDSPRESAELKTDKKLMSSMDAESDECEASRVQPLPGDAIVSSGVSGSPASVPLQVLLPEDMVESDTLPTPSLPGPSTASPPSPQQSVYHIKWIKWKDHKTAIITQNENGPCPLIAIMNVLVLKGKVNLPPIIEMITADQLMEYLGDCILENAPKNISEDAQLNYEQNMHDAMAVLPKLQTGLDVNVKFTGVNDFEYTPECIIFDLLNIPLYHGWLVDPQIPLVVESVGNSSYNQLVERIIRDKASSNVDVVNRALNAESFLERTASQLTYHGLCELNAAVQDDELCVMFRNNHFSTIYKHKNELFQLVTDQGFLTESSVVWETLSSIDGDGQFVDFNFANVPPKLISCTAAAASASVPSVQQIDQDYLVALSLHEEQQRQVEQEMAWQEYKEKQLGIVDTVTDEELARRLQIEEQVQPAQSEQPSNVRGQAAEGTSTSERHNEGKKKSDCTIL